MDAARSQALRTVILFVDGVLIVVSMAVAYGAHALLRHQLVWLKEPPPPSAYAAVVVLALPLWLLLITLLGLDRVLERVPSRARLLWELLELELAGLLGLTAVLFVSQGVINRTLVAAFLVSNLLLLFTERLLFGAWVHYQHTRGHGRTRLLLVGAPGEAMWHFVRASAASPLPPEIIGRLGVTVRGESEPPPPDEAAALLARLGHVEAIEAILEEHPVDAVLFFPPLHVPEEAVGALEVCETLGVPASFSLALPRLHQAEPHVVSLYDKSFVSYVVAPKSHTKLAIKHALDVVIALIALVLLSPVYLFTALAILLTSGRPVFFAQTRAGLRGRPFSLLKFRTMVKGAETLRVALAAENETGGPAFKMTDDPRVTRLGRWLRRTSIDELPQLFNVLTGTMSLVGPRPLPVEEQRQSRGWHRRRLSMKPGLTCLWQIGGRSEIGFEDWMKLDLRYVDSWSLRLDAAILLKTIPAVLSGRGAR